MPVPASGELSLGKIGMEIRATSTSNDYNDGPYTAGETSLDDAESGVYGVVNQNNPSSNMPNLAQANSKMSEWYSYDHFHPSV
jgi:hypothetical protein